MSVYGQTARDLGRFFDLKAERYEERMSSPYWRMMREITWQHVRRYLPRKRGARILDAGGGAGHWSIALARAGCSVVLLDVSERMLEAARAAVAAAGVEDRVEVVHGDVTDLREFSEGSFDAVLAVEETLSFAGDPGMAVAEIALVTRPGGIVAASVANRFRGRDIERLVRRGDLDGLSRTLASGGAAAPTTEAVTCRAFASEEMEALFMANGLETASVIGRPVFAGAAGGRLADAEVFARILRMESEYNANRSLWSGADVLEFVAVRS